MDLKCLRAPPTNARRAPAGGTMCETCEKNWCDTASCECECHLSLRVRQMIAADRMYDEQRVDGMTGLMLPRI